MYKYQRQKVKNYESNFVTNYPIMKMVGENYIFLKHFVEVHVKTQMGYLKKTLRSSAHRTLAQLLMN